MAVVKVANLEASSTDSPKYLVCVANSSAASLLITAVVPKILANAWVAFDKSLPVIPFISLAT